jgi:succinate-semialdehyde dehydrogenase/glutarate-semialdehyde dehydrogenase
MNGDRAAAQPALTQHDLLVGGQWQAAAAGHRYRVASPATGADIADLAAAETLTWTALSSPARPLSRNTRRPPTSNGPAGARTSQPKSMPGPMTSPASSPRSRASRWRNPGGEVTSAAAGFRLAAAEARRLTGETVPVADPAKRVLTFRRPTGVWAVITPWNFPFNIPIEYLGPALATGNAVVWKPAPSTSRIAVRLAECITAAGVPGGLVNLVTGPSVDMARHLSSHPGLVGVCFTGSSSVGKQIAQLAAGKKLLLELGGNGPVIVLKDADLPRTVQAVAAAAFANAGQSCAWWPGSPMRRTRSAWARRCRMTWTWARCTTRQPPRRWSSTLKMEQHIEDALGRNGNLVAGGARLPGMPSRLFFARR